MPQLPSDRAYIFSEETDTESPISEQTMQKIGSAINFLNDLVLQVEQFTSSGTFTVPEGTERIYVLGAGGGGGGGNPQGGGGAGCIPQLVAIPGLSGLEEFTVTIGAGGSGSGGSSFGSPGGNTSFINTVTGDGPIFYGGAPGGYIGSSLADAEAEATRNLLASYVRDLTTGPANSLGGLGMRNVGYDDLNDFRANPAFNKWSNLDYYTIGGAGDTDNSGNGTDGQDSPYGIGGTAPQSIDGGGGGGAGWGDGGNGATIGNSGQSASANSSAGGGGGNVGGGNGGSGILFVLY